MTNSTMTNEQRAAIEKEVWAVMDENWDAARQVDAEGMFGLWADVHNLGSISNGVFFSTLDALQAAFRPSFAQLESQDINISETRVAVLAPNVAIVTTRGEFTANNKDGTTFESASGNTFVLTKVGDNWKVIHAHQSFPWPQTE